MKKLALLTVVGFALVTLPYAAKSTDSAHKSGHATETKASGRDGSSRISGVVKNTAGAPLADVVVTLFDAVQMVKVDSVKTRSDGSYVFERVKPNILYSVRADGTADNRYLPGEVRRSIKADKQTIAGEDITLSARPDDKAVYIGTKACTSCHEAVTPTLAAEFESSAHQRIIALGQGAIINPLGGWAVDNDPKGKRTGVMSVPPDAGDGPLVPVTACQIKGRKGFAFGGGDDDACVSGTFIPISATVGGQGDKFRIPGSDKIVPNVGHFKQHLLAALKDVPATTSPNWEGYPYPGSDKDFILLPVYMAQSGNESPHFAGYRAARMGNARNSWVDEGQAYSQACAGCHVIGLKITTSPKKEHASGEGSVDKKAASGPYVTRSFGYLELEVGCESCHGPGSEHAKDAGRAKNIIMPSSLTAKAEREVCARCHGLALPTSASPAGAMAYPWNDQYLDKVGQGTFIAGIYKLADFMPGWKTGVGFESWDGAHGRHHKQQSFEFEKSVHASNKMQPLVCADCHAAHSLYQGPDHAIRLGQNGEKYDFQSMRFKDNTICLSCHAGSGAFSGLSKDDIAALAAGYGQSTFLDGAVKPVYDPAAKDTKTLAASAKAQNKVASVVTDHMYKTVGMGPSVAYTPLDDNNPVGRCQTCHMPKTGMMGDHTWSDNRADPSLRAMVEGDTSSHVGDVIFPSAVYSMYRSAMASKNVRPKTVWRSVMPTSCGKCHESARYYLK